MAYFHKLFIHILIKPEFSFLALDNKVVLWYKGNSCKRILKKLFFMGTDILVAPLKQFTAIEGKKVYVNADFGDDYRGDGSLDNPYRTIHHALTGNIVHGNASIPIVASGRKGIFMTNAEIQEGIVIEKTGFIFCVLKEVLPYFASPQIDSNGDGIADLGDPSPPLPPTGMPGTHRRDMSPIMLRELGVINYNAFMKGTNE